VTGAADLLDAPADVRDRMAHQAETTTRPMLLNALGQFVDARASLRDQVPGVPHLPVEMAFLRAIERVGAPSAEVRAIPVAAAKTGSVPSPPSPPVESTRAVEGAPSKAPATRQPETPAKDRADQPVAEVSAAPDARTDVVERARASWDRFLSMAGKRCGMKVQAALRSVRTIEGSGHTITLYFSHAFSRDLVNQGENRAQVEVLWEELLGTNVHVRCALLGERPAPPTSSAPAEAAGTVRMAGEEDELLQDARSWALW